MAVLLVAMTGCGREFFREWADQDTSEAIFEKSRDPRFRLDQYSSEPPGLSRFADPFDKDRPPAPPDDYAAQALSPVPQWPDFRLTTPTEGTAYLDMLEFWRSQDPILPMMNPTPEATVPPPPAVTPSPFMPEANSGTELGALSPPSHSGVVPVTAKVIRPNDARDLRVARTAFQATKIPPPAPGSKVKAVAKKPSIDRELTRTQATGTPTIPAPNPPSARPPATGGNPPVIAPRDGLNSPRVPLDPIPINEDLSKPPGAQVQPVPPPVVPMPMPSGPQVSPRDGLNTPRIPLDPNPINEDLSRPSGVRIQGVPPSEGVLIPDDMSNPRNQTDLTRMAEEANELIAMLIPDELDLDEAEAAGLPPKSRPYRISAEQAFALALINNRAYQFQLENVYTAALAVTLQRFAFQPQFIAGISPLTPPAFGNFPVNQPNSFTYRTRETAGGQVSQLTLGQVAGFGKLLGTGGRILGGFAAQTVFNFNSSNPKQPTVQGFLPLSFVQPFLKGGGRAVTLEALTLAERQLLYAIRLFARFRQEFIANILIGSPITNPGLADPSIGYLVVGQDLQQIEIDIRNLRTYEIYFKVYSEQAKGDASGLTQLQVDQFDQSVQGARIQLTTDLFVYRGTLDQFKQQMGLPPDVPLVLSRANYQPFTDVFTKIETWAKRYDRKLEELPDIIDKGLPEFEDVMIDGRSVLDIVRADQEDSSKLEELLLAAERVALENRLELMNARAQLYDSWRQIRFTANALKGIFNVAVTNQILTPPTTTNPFAFVDQAKQFQLVLNAELPLVRVLERNNFKQALINYQRQRRALQFTEDAIKFQVRQEVRNLQTQYRNYKTQQRNLTLSVRQRDQSLLQVIAPAGAGGGAGGQGQSNQAAIQVQNVRAAQGGVVSTEIQLTNLWLQYQTQRILLYRDLGILPYDEWEAFYELFPANSTRSGGVSTSEPGVRPAGPAEPQPVIATPGIGR